MPFEDRALPELPILQCVDVSSKARADWVRSKGLPDAHPWADVLLYSLPFDPGVSVPGMLPTPSSLQREVAPDEHMQECLRTIGWKELVRFNATRGAQSEEASKSAETATYVGGSQGDDLAPLEKRQAIQGSLLGNSTFHGGGSQLACVIEGKGFLCNRAVEATQTPPFQRPSRAGPPRARL